MLKLVVIEQSEDLILDTIGEEWKRTGKCDLAVAKEKFLLALTSAFILQKNSPYTKEIRLE